MKKIIVFILILVFLAVPLSKGTEQTIRPIEKFDIEELSIPNSNEIKLDNFFGEDNLLVNAFPNGEFNEIDIDGGPTDLSHYGSSYYNYSNKYEDLVQSGSFSYMMETQASQYYSSPSASLWFNTAPYKFLNETLVFNYWAYHLSNPIIIQDSVYVRFRLRNYDNGTNYYFYHYLSSNGVSSNNSYNVYLNHNSTSFVWNNYNLELSQIFSNEIGSFADVYLYDIRFYVTSQPNSPTITRLVLDNLSLTNSSVYEYLPNGDFEGVDFMNNPGRGSVDRIQVHSEGTNNYLNITSQSVQEYGYGGAYIYSSYWSDQDQIPISSSMGDFYFDYKYTDTNNGGSNQESYIYLYLYNSTYEVYVYYYLGDDDTDSLPGNSTQPTYSYVYLNGSNIDNKGEWNSESIDIYQITNDLNLTRMRLRELQFIVQSGQRSNSTVTLLLDNVILPSTPVRDAGFEEDYEQSLTDPFPHWVNGGFSYPTFNRTRDSYSGNWALNLTVIDDETVAIWRDMYDLEIKKNYFVDFKYRLDESTPGSASNAYISLELDGGNYLYYILDDDSENFFNDTWSAVYLIDEDNPGDWSTLNRNIWDDITKLLGDRKWNITEIRLGAQAGISERTSILFDELHFYADTTAPHLTDIGATNGQYYQDRLVFVQGIDAISELSDVYLEYTTGTDWSRINSTIGQDFFEMLIPKQPYGTTVEYYFVVTDTYGNQAIDDNSGLYYSYIVGDDLSPEVELVLPYNNTEVHGEIILKAYSTDPGSGVGHVEIFIDGSLTANISSSPYSATLDTRLLSNGNHEIIVTAFDSAGNSATSDVVNVVVNNDVDGPLISDILATPIIPDESQEITFAVSVLDASEITNVTLFTKLNDGSWQSTALTNFEGLYTAILDPIDSQSALYYYVEATDEFDQTSNKGSVSSPFLYGRAEALEGLAALQEQGGEIFANNEFYFGMGSMVGLWGIIQIFKLRAKRKSKSTK